MIMLAKGIDAKEGNCDADEWLASAAAAWRAA
jgi:hypothetical protein